MAVRKTRIRLSRRIRSRRLLWLVAGALALAVGIWFLFRGGNGDERLHPPAKVGKNSAGEWVRGTIYDSRKKRLAETIEQVSVYVRTREAGSISETARQLASVLSLDRNSLEGRLKRGALRVWIARQISQEQEDALGKLALPGVYLEKEWRRSYPNGAMASHMIGFSDNGVGLAGVEYQYDRLLSRINEQGAEGREMRTDLVLSLDMKIQQPLEDVLATVRSWGTSRGQDVRVVGCVLDAKSGSIVALGQLPGFDPNDFALYGSRILGSMMFKPMLVPETIRVLLRDSAVFLKTDDEVEAYGGWSLIPKAKAGKQLQLITALNLDRKIYADFYSGPRDQKPFAGYLLQRDRNRGLDMMPEVSTPMTLLVGLSTLLHGLPAGEPAVIAQTVKSTDQVGQPVEKIPFPGPPPVLVQKGVEGLFSAMGEKGNFSTIYLEGKALGTIPEESTGDVFLQDDVVFADIPSGERPMVLLLVAEVRGYAPFSRENTLEAEKLNIRRLIDEKMRRMGILHMVSAGASDLLPAEEGAEGNWQSKGTIVVQGDSVINRKKGKKDEPVKMPDIMGRSLRKSLRMLEGIPLKLSIEGSGRVVQQSPEAGTILKKNASCQIILKQKHLDIFKAVNEEKTTR
ncbi:MAG: PASTA domain-containing protein [Desulforhopalus sp.]|nr:PASTA domain-containing protein [Desulforhopalus sp.]